MVRLTTKLRVLGIKKKTSAKFFKGLAVGDEFELRYNLNGHFGSVPTIGIYVDNRLTHTNEALQLSKNLSNFEMGTIS